MLRAGGQHKSDSGLKGSLRCRGCTLLRRNYELKGVVQGRRDVRGSV